MVVAQVDAVGGCGGFALGDLFVQGVDFGLSGLGQKRDAEEALWERHSEFWQ